jgi:DNA-binding PadR family transcriptional regulator
MYELFVLGELMTEPKHGYRLQESLKHAVGPVRRISSGTLYPLISRLVTSGRIRLQFEGQQDGGRTRKLYQITEAGRVRFQELMMKPLELSVDTELMFQFKMAYFPHVTKDVRIACLDQYREYIQYNLEYVKSETILISQKKIPEKKRVQLLRMFDYRKHIGSAALQWVTEEIEGMKQAGE